MTGASFAALATLAAHILIVAALVLRILLRPHRDPASRIAWVLVILSLPFLGALAYILLGEVNIGRARVRRLESALARLPDPAGLAPAGEGWAAAEVPERYRHLFRVGRSISGFEPIGGNSGALMADSNAAIDALVADIDGAQAHVHLLFYIWLADHNGLRVAEALKRAVGRGVTCRALADDLGSRLMIESPHWSAMAAAGVHLARALPIGNPLLRPLRGRIDLRNHRKIVVIDDRITYCGSQNCADPEFRVKPKFAPWVDAVIRFEGPIARQNQHLFASDWMTAVDEDLGDLLRRPFLAGGAGLPAQVIGTGPTVRHSAMPELFESLMHAARRELTITTPYFVPDDGLQGALCAAAYRGVVTTLILPERNDSWVVAAAARSYYPDLLAAGVRLYAYRGGLLHTKSLTLDGDLTLIGSANLDRRSFDLNYENNILFYDPDLTASVMARQAQYLASSRPITPQEVAGWSVSRRLADNVIAMLGPVL